MRKEAQEVLRRALENLEVEKKIALSYLREVVTTFSKAENKMTTRKDLVELLRKKADSIESSIPK